MIPYRECEIEMGGFNNRMVFCRDPDKTVTIFCDDKKFPKALSAASSGLLDEQLGISIRKMRGQSRRATIFGAACLIGIVLFLVGCYYGVRYGAIAAIHAMPVSVDRKIGEAAFESMDVGGPEVDDQDVVFRD